MHQPQLTTADERGLERDRYVVLLHVYTVGQADADHSVAAHRIMTDLGLDSQRLELVLRGLIQADLLEFGKGGDGVSLAARGIEYIERTARRRRSVRLPS